MKNDFKALQLNICGLISKQNELSKLITGCLNNNKIDIVILCETWLTPQVNHLVQVLGYQFYGIERNTKKGGGVGFLVAKEIKFKPRKDLSTEDHSFKNCFIEVTSNGRNAMCCSIYRPPNSDAKEFQKQKKSMHGQNKVRNSQRCTRYGP